jgi:hypothetical protein
VTSTCELNRDVSCPRFSNVVTRLSCFRESAAATDAVATVTRQPAWYTVLFTSTGAGVGAADGDRDVDALGVGELVGGVEPCPVGVCPVDPPHAATTASAIHVNPDRSVVLDISAPPARRCKQVRGRETAQQWGVSLVRDTRFGG